MQKKSCYTAGITVAVALAPLAVLAGQELAGPASAFAAEASVTATPSSESPSSESSSTVATTAPVVTESPSAGVTPEPSQGTPTPDPTSPDSPTPEPTTAAPEPTSPLPSPSDSEPVPVPSESVIVVPIPPDASAQPDITGGAAGLPDEPVIEPTAQPSTGSNQVEVQVPVAPEQGSSDLPSTLANSVAGAQAPGRMDADSSQLETSPLEGSVLGIFSSSQQGSAYTGAPEWVEGFLNATSSQADRGSSADPNQAAGVAGAEAQEQQAGALAGSSIFQRGNTIMNGAQPLLIFTGIAAAGLTVVIFNFIWRSRAPKN